MVFQQVGNFFQLVLGYVVTWSIYNLQRRSSMDNKASWVKLSGSINFNIRGLWKENLLRSSEELADEYIQCTLVAEDSYSYLDKQTYEFIPISEEDVKDIRRIFIERVNRKKEKYSEELKELKAKIELDKRNIKLAKVIEFPLNFKK